MSEEEKKEELLKQISKELYKDEWFIEKAIISYKSQQEKTYTFYKDNDEENLITKYNWCQRPCDTNMSLCRFVINGEVEGYMSESLVSHFNNLEQIDLNEFIHYFVKPLIKETIEQQKENEKLKDKNKTLERLLQGNLYEMYLYYKELASKYQANCVSKNTIIEKIKELEETKEKYFAKQIIQGRIDLLKEILKE